MSRPTTTFTLFILIGAFQYARADEPVDFLSKAPLHFVANEDGPVLIVVGELVRLEDEIFEVSQGQSDPSKKGFHLGALIFDQIIYGDPTIRSDLRIDQFFRRSNPTRIPIAYKLFWLPGTEAWGTMHIDKGKRQVFVLRRSEVIGAYVIDPSVQTQDRTKLQQAIAVRISNSLEWLSGEKWKR